MSLTYVYRPNDKELRGWDYKHSKTSSEIISKARFQ